MYSNIMKLAMAIIGEHAVRSTSATGDRHLKEWLLSFFQLPYMHNSNYVIKKLFFIVHACTRPYGTSVSSTCDTHHTSQ